ncbi:sigma-70 family RNA polymerase sigma factor [Heliorestis convoluta]|uniref:RNA polymerase sigma factor, sigma-70 family protein n=1 Tax=Heliorestis convoluta TaxID=356322 RepID=A0A5Q2N2M8_9FIRM|nr:sigma-70 family RNA polymerase sigma factor [Heliorestis convoluta]QGG46590.1 RNA polymerase sigma factor, sigma-70 family protein [Heliorestis convoluta]
MEAHIAKEQREETLQPDALDRTVERYRQSGSEQDLEEVMKAGKALIRYFARLYAPDQSQEDAVQCGYEGLLKAISQYDPAYGTRFTTYASHCIMGEIRHFVRKEAAFCRPVWIVQLQKQVNQTIEERLKKGEDVPSLQEIAEELNVQERGVAEAMRAGWVSLEELDLSRFRNQRYESFRLPIEDKILLRQAIARLNKEQQKLIHLLFYQDMTQVKAAEILGITQRQVSRLLKRTLHNLMRYIS